ncbi:D-alanyl-D-alanine carboxypeptidase family protein [Magnetospirillum sp. UT-4]|uniref:D-alanyl-D-alanine carboxypeptidase family protein n=1 Tax=Magnetospirillum sp. UT-4 TaxID=2681467 RepID=UPI00137CE6DF|nr:D-alanyl-D-alanine carboxypeptidase family protein [Magnetospirillum sp. UT-4]CAA7619692.1 Predicted peptidase S11, D-alanyl-D-alanine carboxypeptidase 1 [Magnetospirillum sp. UT-4]
MRAPVLRLPLLLACLAALADPARADPPPPATIVVDAASGRVLAQERAGQPRHPASLTKLMTVYLAFKDIAAGRAARADTIRVSERAATQPGSTLGLKAGTAIGLEQALRAVVVRSANDAAVAVAEHLAGSEDAFAGRMTAEAARLGMTATRFANASGLTAPGHLSTARDMAVLALALKRDFPAAWPLFATREVAWGKARLPTVNGFLAAYPGAEGLKTGFTCHAGYNLAAAASRGQRRAVAVVMGSASKESRLALAARLLDRAFAATSSEGLMLAELGPQDGPVPDLAAAVCSGAVPGETAATPRVPPGWALELAFGRDRAQVARDLAAARRKLGSRLGGTPVVLLRPFDGGLRYRGLVAGLAQDKAVPLCLGLRAEGGEERCLVLPPAAVEAAVNDERRYRMIAARE